MNVFGSRKLMPESRRAVLLVILSIVAAYGILILRFSLRNDQTNYFLPVRMYMSDAFHHHEYMLWNPFMSGSYPIHSDMQGPVWNPVAVLLCWLFRYNSSTLSVELLTYFLAGAIGCFYFAQNFSQNRYSCIVIAVAYGCSGFGTSILEFMDWAGSFAFLPWAIHFFYRLLKRPGLYSGIRFSIALWLLLVCGYPSFIIYLGYVLLAAGAAYFYLLYSQNRQTEIAGMLRYGLLAVVFFVILSMPAIHSFFEYLPHYARGTRAFDSQLNFEYFSCNYPMSLVLPVAGLRTWKNEFYLGLVPILVLLSGIGGGQRWAFRDWFLLAGIVFTLLFTMGRSTPVRMWAARYLPLLGTFGFSHSVGIFLMPPLFLWLAPKLDIVFSEGMSGRIAKRLRWGACIAGVVLLVYVLVGLLEPQPLEGPTRFFYSIYYSSVVWQLFLIVTLCLAKRIYTSRRLLLFFILMDLVVSVLMVAPLAGFSLTRPRVYNRFAERFYAFPINDHLMAPAAESRQLLVIDEHSGINAVKLIPRADFPSNTRLDTFYRYVSDSSRYEQLLSRAFVFSGNSKALKVSKIDLGYNFIDIDVKAEDSCQMVVQQTFHQRWRSEQPEYTPSIYKGIYLQIALRKGENKVRLYYYKTDLVIEAVVSLLLLLTLVGILFIHYRRGR